MRVVALSIAFAAALAQLCCSAGGSRPATATVPAPRPRPTVTVTATTPASAPASAPAPGTIAAGAPASAPARAKAAPRSVALRVKWSKVVVTAGCFFFSGPNQLGRDTKLGDRATLERLPSLALLLRFGAARFDGITSGQKVRLTRKADRAHNGSVWRTREVIEGILRGGGLSGSYSYEECNTGGASCPGKCRISASLEATP